MTTLAKALTTEMLGLLDGELTVAKARRIEKVAHQAAALLHALDPTPDAHGKLNLPPPSNTPDEEGGIGQYAMGGVGPYTVYQGTGIGSYQSALASSPAAETFGARTIRELMAALPMLLKGQTETPLSLVNAIAEARQQGMPDVAAELEKKLVGKSLDGDRPRSLPFMRAKAAAAVAETLAANPPHVHESGFTGSCDECAASTETSIASAPLDIDRLKAPVLSDPPSNKCPATIDRSGGNVGRIDFYCVLDDGHEGEHLNQFGGKFFKRSTDRGSHEVARQEAGVL